MIDLLAGELPIAEFSLKPAYSVKGRNTLWTPNGRYTSKVPQIRNAVER